MYENVRRFKHDYNNLLIGLTEALRRDDSTDALSLLSTEETILANFSTRSYNTYRNKRVLIASPPISEVIICKFDYLFMKCRQLEQV